MLDRQLITLGANQRLIDMNFSYVPGANELVASLNGQVLIDGINYLELGPTQVYLIDLVDSGELLELRKI